MNAPAANTYPRNNHSATQVLNFPMVEGAFDVDQSCEQVIQLLLELRRFHQKRSFSHQERFGHPEPWSEKMQVALTQAIADAKQLINDANQSNTRLALESYIRIEQLKNEQSSHA